MYLFFPLVLFCLIPEIFLYHILVGVLPHCIHIVADRPESPAPKLPFDLGMKSENFLCRDAIQSVDDFSRGEHRDTLNKKMGVVPIKANLQKVDLVPLLYFQTHRTEGLQDLLAQRVAAVLDRTDKMIHQQTLVVALVDVIAHTHKNRTSRYTRGRASGNSIKSNIPDNFILKNISFSQSFL